MATSQEDHRSCLPLPLPPPRRRRHALEAYKPLRIAIEEVQADGCSVGEAIEHILEKGEAARVLLHALAPGDRKQCDAVFAKRHHQMLEAPAMLGNILDHRFRGTRLSVEQRPAHSWSAPPPPPWGVSRMAWPRRKALEALPDCAAKLGMPNVDINEVLKYLGRVTPYDVTPDMEPYLFWKVWMPESPLSQLGRVFTSLPASQAGIERLFSACGFTVEGRTRLLIDNMASEVLLRVNARQLGWIPR